MYIFFIFVLSWTTEILLRILLFAIVATSIFIKVFRVSLRNISVSNYKSLSNVLILK